MPLVVPGLMSNDKDKTSHWQNQLMGKKLGDTSDETVSQPNSFAWHATPPFFFRLPFLLTHYPHLQTFAKKDLPEIHRVVKEGDMLTMDHNPDRLTIQVGEDGTVTNFTHG
jgi:hypothetical protein